MAQNAKPVETITWHATKAEKTMRKEGNQPPKGNKVIKVSEAVKKNERAYAYFKRLVDIFKGIDLNDAFYENVLNRYCILLAECDEHSAEIKQQQAMIFNIDQNHSEMSIQEYYGIRNEMVKTLNKTEGLLTSKRNQLLAIEKENLLTAQAKLRAVPKQNKEKQLSAIEEFRRKYS